MTMTNGRNRRAQAPGPLDVARTLLGLYRKPRFTSAMPSESIPYLDTRRRGIAPMADIYLPEGAGPETPSVLIVHGGGFFIGSRSMKPVRLLATRLLAASFAAMAFDYRMIFRGGRLREGLEDVSAAFAFWRRLVEKRGFDMCGISAVGLSAGATLMLLAAAQEEIPPVKRLVSFFGLYELDHLQGPFAGLLPRLLLRSTDRGLWRRASPIAASQPASPLLLLHGTHDTLVPHEQMGKLSAVRKAKGLETTTISFEGQPHAFLNDEGPAADRAVLDLLRFLA